MDTNVIRNIYLLFSLLLLVLTFFISACASDEPFIHSTSSIAQYEVYEIHHDATTQENKHSDKTFSIDRYIESKYNNVNYQEVDFKRNDMLSVYWRPYAVDAEVLPYELYGPAPSIFLPSEGIIAYEPIFSEPRFGLAPFYVLEDEYPALTNYPGSFSREFDWSVFEDRLLKAEYFLKVHESLESELDSIIRINLSLDQVVFHTREVLPHTPPIFTSTEVFDRFVNENVTIEIFDMYQPSAGDNYESTSPVWIVLEAYSFYDDNRRCHEHVFYLALVEFTESQRTFWELKTVKEPGCGLTFSETIAALYTPTG